MNEKQKELIDEWDYFLTKINFGQSALDARAISFMNTFEKLVMEITK
jgi:hypothetical protein